MTYDCTWSRTTLHIDIRNDIKTWKLIVTILIVLGQIVAVNGYTQLTGPCDYSIFQTLLTIRLQSNQVQLIMGSAAELWTKTIPLCTTITRALTLGKSKTLGGESILGENTS